MGADAQEAGNLVLLMKVVNLLAQRKVGEAVTIVSEKFLFTFKYFCTAFNLTPILELTPVSANVIRQS